MSPLQYIQLLLGMLVAASVFAGEQETLGRLFFTPQERLQLEQQRYRSTNDLPGSEQGTMTLNGEVRSSNGRSTRWINGSPIWDSSRQDTARLPVGDSLNLDTGVREPLIGNGKIIIKKYQIPR